MNLRPLTRNNLALIVCLLIGAALAPCYAQSGGDRYGTFDKNRGVFPESGKMKRPYIVNFTSKFDGAKDYFTISFPKNFDPNKTYPLWFKFCPFFGSRSALKRQTLAWNYSDANDVILIGCNERGVGDSWLGDNEQLLMEKRQKRYKKRMKTNKAFDPSNIRKDILELLNEMCHLFKINYIGATGASMGGYASLRLMTHLPKEYVGVVVSSCPAIYSRSWVKKASDEITAKVKSGHFNGKFVMIIHGTDDKTVPIQRSRDLTANAPDKKWWKLVEVKGAGHAPFFVVIDYKNKKYPYDEDWGKSKVVPDIWDQIRTWEKAHPETVSQQLKPLEGWRPDGKWYLPKEIVDASVKKPMLIGR